MLEDNLYDVRETVIGLQEDMKNLRDETKTDFQEIKMQLQSLMNVVLNREDKFEEKSLDKRESSEIHTETKSSPKTTKRFLEPNRLPDGQLNFQVPFRPSTVILPSQAHLYGETNFKNKVIFKNDTKLSTTDENSLNVLRSIQDQLVVALVPYNLWAMKVAFVMDDDFQQLATWAKRNTVTWLDLVEAVLQVLKSNHKLYCPMTSFARLKPDKNKTDLDFARRIRYSYYRLLPHLQDSLASRETFNDILEQYLLSSLLHLENKRDKVPLATLIEELIRVNKLQYQKVKFKSDMENRSLLPSISNPIFEDRTINAVKELNDHCYKCGKIEKNMVYIKKFEHVQTTKPTENKLPVRQYTENRLQTGLKRFLNRHLGTRTDVSKSNNSFPHVRSRQKNKAYPIDELENSEVDKSPAERLGDSDDDEELDILLSNLLNDNSQ
ncbi:hypothetical protein EPUL_004798 [Erysiphe pulchra]|uniref:Uncharacterized protein n=1 Tax=Erysiphe pulchra TaxID=225359 RepID=A0A2S4PLJ4_9PEZI|nr:hypothetical protein EPUL_004798 [Erysiphe pulchra]